MTTTSSKSKPKKKKSRAGLVVAGVATAAVVGAGVYLLSGSASAKSPAKKPKGANAEPKPKGSGSSSPPRGAKGPGRSGGGSKSSGRGSGDAGGSLGPGGTIPSEGSGKGGGSKKPKGKAPKDKGSDEGKESRSDEPKGFWWGDRSKVPADFDFQSNQIWISGDRSAAAAGFHFFLDGHDAKGERVTWDEDGLSFLISDGTVPTPTADRDHREDPVPSLRKILRKKDPDTGELRGDSVFSWVAAYYGTGISPLEAATSRGVDLLQDMVDEASVLSGGSKGAMDLSGPLRDFYGYALGRLEMGRKAIYGDGFAWGQGEDAIG